LLTVRGTIPPMRYTGHNPSGTVLWSVLLPMSREAGLTRTGSGLEGSVRQVLPVRYTSVNFVAGVGR
jgi:hypothetical protein